MFIKRTSALCVTIIKTCVAQCKFNLRTIYNQMGEFFTIVTIKIDIHSLVLTSIPWFFQSVVPMMGDQVDVPECRPNDRRPS
ncbi:hypothetical protein RDWZM_007449 [Blomia tropicalis]|uniref:Uncharacterized protein n=1 Tax=Blomia tropicalis TaxID=40697 RepID=A0A9Q0LZW8_BLOTA|nr:hypothetical protein RDWZM_007449 [Blomia tropicalis]